MSKPIGLTVISNDDYYRELADGLRENLSAYNYDLIIHVVNVDKANSWNDLQKFWQIKDETLIEFASQNDKRIWLLDAEVRLVKNIPQHCIDTDKSVIFYNDYLDQNSDVKTYPPVNIGQCIWSKDMIPYFAQSIEIAKNKTKRNLDIPYNTERVLLDFNLPDHVKEMISHDRRLANKRSICSAGLFVNDSTCITHPYLHNLPIYDEKYEYDISPIAFVNHFSPYDFDLAQNIFDLVSQGIDDPSHWRKLQLQRFGNKKQFISYFSEIAPKKIQNNNHRTKNSFCYSIADWYFCPKLRLVGPKKNWSEYAYRLTDQ
jgi:hypothetical protein